MNTQTPPAALVIGTFNFRLFQDKLAPTLQRLHKPALAPEAMLELRAMVPGIPSDRRDELSTLLDRLESQAQNGRPARSSSGAIVELACLDEVVHLPDRTKEFQAAIELLFRFWDRPMANTIFHFFSSLSDHTLTQISTAEIWRALVPPDALVEPVQATEALTRGDLRRLLLQAEKGDVFSEDEAQALAEWWDEVRSKIRMAQRLEAGLFVSTRRQGNGG